MSCAPKVTGETVRASLRVFTRRESMYEQQSSLDFYSIFFVFVFGRMDLLNLTTRNLFLISWDLLFVAKIMF